MSQRADQRLSELFPGLSRSRAQSLIEQGAVQLRRATGQWQVIKKPSYKLQPPLPEREDFQIDMEQDLSRVSRAALKLQGALDHFSVSVRDSLCLDVGQSTGGFTQVLLQRGAKKVLGVDVGRDQLHQSLRLDPRVMCAEKVNARHPLPSDLLAEFFKGESQNSFDLIVIDVSFISLSLVVPAQLSHLASEGHLLVLVKPQFELERSALNKKGVVKNAGLNNQALQKIIEVFKFLNLDIIGHIPSPIEGEHGNQEYLLLARLCHNNEY